MITFSTSPLHSDRPEVHTEDPLRQFFGAYFHQDWDCDASSTRGVVDLYLRATQPDEARRLAEAIRAYSASFADDAELEHRLSNDLGCEYWPAADGVSVRAFLEQIADQLTGPHCEAQREIAAIAARIADQSLAIPEGLREIVRLRHSLAEADRDDPDLLSLVGVESEIDEFPVGETRSRWAAEALAEQDRALNEYLGRARETLFAACRSLRSRWGAKYARAT